MAVHSGMENVIAENLSKLLSPYVLILFGSAAKGTMNPDSDIDIAFLSDRSFSPYELFLAAQTLAEQLGREVDLVDLNQASTVMRAQIIGTGKVLVDREPSRRKDFFIRSFKEYALLNEEREPILKRLEERGSLYDG